MATRPRIAVVGASARAAAFSLLRQGDSVVAADLFADADLRRVCEVERVTNYPHGLVDWLVRTVCDVWIYTGALENYPELVDSMAALRPLRGNPGSVLRAVRDPLLLQATLADAGLQFPSTVLCNCSSPGQGNWLHKTGQGASGSGVSEFDPRNRLIQGYWQRRIAGLPGSAVFDASTQTCSLLGITRQLVGETWTRASPFQYSGTLSPWPLPEQAVVELSKMGEVVALKFNLRGIFGVDFVFDDPHVWLIEVNPRTTAAVEVVERANDSRFYAGKVILYAKHPLTVSRATSDELLHRAGSLEHPQLADIPNAGTKVSPGEPILTLFAEGDSLEMVEAKLRQGIAKLEEELYGAIS